MQASCYCCLTFCMLGWTVLGGGEPWKSTGFPGPLFSARPPPMRFFQAKHFPFSWTGWRLVSWNPGLSTRQIAQMLSGYWTSLSHGHCSQACPDLHIPSWLILFYIRNSRTPCQKLCFQPWTSKESPFPNLLSIDSDGPSFQYSWRFRFLYLQDLREDPISLSLMSLMLQNLQTSSSNNFSSWHRSSTSAHILQARRQPSTSQPQQEDTGNPCTHWDLHSCILPSIRRSMWFEVSDVSSIFLTGLLLTKSLLYLLSVLYWLSECYIGKM